MHTYTLPDDIVKSSGPLILGYLFNWALFGVVTIQVCTVSTDRAINSLTNSPDYYYIAFPRDRTFCKVIVYGVYLLETLQTIIVSRDAFLSFGLGFGDFKALDDIQLTCLSIPILSGIVGCIVQMYYAYRINILSKTRRLSYAIAAVSICGCGGAIATGIKSFELGSLSKLSVRTVFITAGIWWGCCALCDVTIAIAMTYLLSCHESGFRHTQLVVQRLIRITIETGSCTAVMAIVNLGLFFGFPLTNYYTVPVLIIAKFYCNTLLVLFNSRMRIVGSREEMELEDGYMTSPRRGATTGIAFSRPVSAAFENWQDMDKSRSHSMTLTSGTLSPKLPQTSSSTQEVAGRPTSILESREVSESSLGHVPRSSDSTMVDFQLGERSSPNFSVMHEKI